MTKFARDVVHSCETYLANIVFAGEAHSQMLKTTAGGDDNGEQRCTTGKCILKLLLTSGVLSHGESADDASGDASVR
jgi:hypothetical protein